LSGFPSFVRVERFQRGQSLLKFGDRRQMLIMRFQMFCHRIRLAASKAIALISWKTVTSIGSRAILGAIGVDVARIAHTTIDFLARLARAPIARMTRALLGVRPCLGAGGMRVTRIGSTGINF